MKTVEMYLADWESNRVLERDTYLHTSNPVHGHHFNYEAYDWLAAQAGTPFMLNSHAADVMFHTKSNVRWAWRSKPVFDPDQPLQKVWLYEFIFKEDSLAVLFKLTWC